MKLVIVKPAATYFADELLNHMSIHAFALETGVRIYNPGRFGRGLWRIPHSVYARIVGKLHSRERLDAWRPPFFLPPTAPLPVAHQSSAALYFYGWLFRNPKGLEAHREQLLKTFAPSNKTTQRIHALLAPFGERVRVGVHIRQTPYPGFADGTFVVSPQRVREVVDEYLREHALTKNDVVLCVVSDREVPANIFADFATIAAPDNTELGFYLLTVCSVVIGTNSNNANFPTWFSGESHIVATNEPIDWVYYRETRSFTNNKYATLTHGLTL